jgi:hypothetical protein
MELNGKVIFVGETEVFGTNNFKKRNLVIETDEQYPQKIQIEFVQAKCDLLDVIQVGSMVKVYINIGGREWVNPQGETKYFNSITGWRIELNNTAMAEAGGDPFP